MSEKPDIYRLAVGAEWGQRVADALNYQHQDFGWVRYIFFLNWSEKVSWAVDSFECVNFHCTRLPDGRGGHPIENLILRGDTETVITAHRMTHELDAGPVYAVSEPISLAGTKEQIQQRFVEPVADLIRYIVKEEPTPTPQVGEPTYFKRLSPEAYAEFWRARG